MKKKILLLSLLSVCALTQVTSCGGTNGSSSITSKTSESETSSSNATVESSSSSASQKNSEEEEIASLKTKAIKKLDGLVKTPLEKITHEGIKTKINEFYQTELNYINSINSLTEAQNAYNKIDEDIKEYIDTTLRTFIISKIDEIINPLINKITDETLKSSVKNYYDSQITKLASISTIEDLITTYNSIVNDTKEFIKQEVEKALIALKNKAIETLDVYLSALIDRIPYDELKVDVNTFYIDEKKKLEAIDDLDEVNPCVEEIKQDLENFALTETKKIALTKLDEAVNKGLDKLPNETIKQDLKDFAVQEKTKLNNVATLEDVVPTLTTVLNETQDHIKSLLVETVKDYFEKLTRIETATAYDYLPKAMAPTYANNIVDVNDINYDFTNDTQVSSILKQGYGEQWQMVIENINQSVQIANVFNVAQTALNAAGNAVKIYIDNSYAETISYDFNGESYNGSFKFENNKMIFEVNVTTNTTVPGIGTVKPIVKMSYDLATETKTMFISLGDAYKVKYVIKDNYYELALTYGITISGQNVSRSSYLSIDNSSNKTVGHLYEYTTYNGSDKIKACADFYVENDYVTVVGNKASGMVAFDGYVNELYKASEGRLIGYEVRETKTILGVTGTYNTLWFNLWDISGINSIKVTDKTDSNKSSRSTYDVYLNGGDKLLSPAYNSKLTVKTSRKYDIELRSRYYYTYDSENNKYVANEVLVPMMFIQEDNDIDTNFSDYPSDMKKNNGITSSVTLNNSLLNKIQSDYDTYIDIFIVNKENMSSDQIVQYLEAQE